LTAALGCDPDVIIGYAPDAGEGSEGASDGSSESDAAIGGPAPMRDAAVTDSGPSMRDGSAPADAGDSGALTIEITWRTGAHSGSNLENYLAFGEWRGRPLGVASVYLERTKWDGIVQPAWPLDMMRDFSGPLLISLPLYPEGGMYNNADCAAGMYDAEWKKLGTFLVARSRGDSILRLGWGWNDLEHDWRADSDPANWIACYRRAVDAIRSTASRARFEWSFNAPGAPEIMPGDPYAGYPGDEYVDYVSFEVFDRYPPLRTDAEWNAQCDQPGGLCKLFEFARQHGKKVGIGEWGVATCGGDAGGDNPYFVQRMVRAFYENRDLMAYEAYFEDSVEVCSALSIGTKAPKAAAKYRELYMR
jgi:hypothetical protein